MRIAIQCRALALGAGGMERTAATLANHLNAAGHQVALIYRDRGVAPLYPVGAGVTLCPVELTPEAFARAAADFAPDVALHFYPDVSSVALIRALALTGVPVVLHEGTNADRLIGAGWAEWLDMPLAAAARQRDALSATAARVRVTLPDYRDSFSPALRPRVVSFPNAFAPAAFDLAAEAAAAPAPRFIHIGGLKANKNLLPAVAAFLRVAGDLPGWRFAIFSADPAGGEVSRPLRAMLAASAHGGRVDILPPTPKIFREYARSRVHVISSLSEGLPNCVAEAMCHGVPSIGFASCPGTNTLIRDGANGVLVDDVGDGVPGGPDLDALREDGLAAAMLRLGRDEGLRAAMGAQALADAAMFDPQAIFARWEALLGEAARQPGYPRRVDDAAGDDLLRDDGVDSIGRVLVTGLGFAPLPSGMRADPGTGLWQAGGGGETPTLPDGALAQGSPLQGYVICGPAPDAAEAAALAILARDAAAARVPVALMLPADAQGVPQGAPALWQMDAQALTGWLSGPSRMLVSLALLRELGLDAPPAQAVDHRGTLAMVMAGALMLCVAPAGVMPGGRMVLAGVDTQLMAALAAGRLARAQGALPGLEVISELRAGLLIPVMGGDLRPATVAAWRDWLMTDPDLPRRVSALSPHWALRAALALEGFTELAQRAVPLAGLASGDAARLSHHFEAHALRAVVLPALRRAAADQRQRAIPTPAGAADAVPPAAAVPDVPPDVPPDPVPGPAPDAAPL